MSDGGVNEQSPPPPRPDAIRVARRAMALYAVASRASFEWAAPVESGEEYRTSLLQWVAKRRLDGEFEAGERELLATPVGTPEARVFLAAAWRVEGAAVLGWALGLLDLPRVDCNVGIAAVGDALSAPPPWDDLQLRDEDQITRFEGMYYNLNWRVHHYRHDPAPYDLRRLLRDYDAPFSGAAPIQ